VTPVPLIRWDAPGRHLVAFSTRDGGVSSGPYDSLNLGRLTGDDPACVEENRGRLCGSLGVDEARLSFNRQVHGAAVRRAGTRGEEGDALWTTQRGQAMLVFAADCLPIALVADDGEPAAAAVHAGWRGLLAGVVEGAVAAVGGTELAACVGPAIGACCYEVGEDVAGPFRARFGAGVARAGRLDLRRAAESALRAAGVRTVEHVDLCTACRPDLFYSHRRDGGVTGRQGLVVALR
jgi:YfiH family protein